MREDIKNLVHFQRLNLAADVYPSPPSGTCNLDLILCRNLLIYLESETVRDISRRLLECLAAGGWLITASGGPPLADLANFDVVSTEHGLFYRRPCASDSLGIRTDSEGSRFQRGGSRRFSKPATQRTENDRAGRSGPARGMPIDWSPAADRQTISLDRCFNAKSIAFSNVADNTRFCQTEPGRIQDRG